jgi:hypothetical protein
MIAPFVTRARAGNLPAADLTPHAAVEYCTTRGCVWPATARVLVGATPLPKCFTHEREYADRYGSTDIRPLSPQR